MRLSTSNKGWHSHWFYIKDDVAAPLSTFFERIIEEVPGSWKWGVPEKDKKKIRDHLIAIWILKERGLKESSIIGAYNMRRVALLMRRASSTNDGTRGVIRGDSAHRGSSFPLQSGVAHQGGDGASAG